MQDTPHDSDIAVFCSFAANVMCPQHQLHPDYDSDRQLRDRRLNAVEILTIQDALRDSTPLMSQQLVNREPNGLSSQLTAAGTSAAQVAENVEPSSKYEQDMSLNTLCQLNGVYTKRSVKM